MSYWVLIYFRSVGCEAETTSYAQLLEHMREERAQKGYQQVPQFVSSMLVDLKKPFHLDTLWVEVQ